MDDVVLYVFAFVSFIVTFIAACILAIKSVPRDSQKYISSPLESEDEVSIEDAFKHLREKDHL